LFLPEEEVCDGKVLNRDWRESGETFIMGTAPQAAKKVKATY
jgi:hypothetical protein